MTKQSWSFPRDQSYGKLHVLLFHPLKTKCGLEIDIADDMSSKWVGVKQCFLENQDEDNLCLKCFPLTDIDILLKFGINK